MNKHLPLLCVKMFLTLACTTYCLCVAYRLLIEELEDTKGVWNFYGALCLCGLCAINCWNKYNFIGDIMEALGLTHKDLAKALGVSETTIKSYRRKFPACITVASKGKPIRFAPEAETVCRRIQALFALGMAVEDVRMRLAEEFAWIEPECPCEVQAVQDADGTSSPAAQTEHKKALLSEAALLKEALQHAGATPHLDPVPTQKTITPQVEPIQSPVQPKEPSEQASAKTDAPRTTPYTVLPPEVRTAISDMARSVVELTLQQKKLMKHVQSLEERLEKALSANGAVAPQHSAPQGLCPQTPIHEQIAAPLAESLDSIAPEVSSELSPEITQEAAAVSEPVNEPKQSRNPLLKIFGLERHG